MAAPSATARGSTYDRAFVSSPADATSKRIIICCDGTWQSAVSLDPKQGCSSNVARLSRVVAKAGKDGHDKTWNQIVYYDAGVGTGDITDFEKQRQGGLGIGLIENVIEAYNYIVSNFNAGDELYFFGFSRGAYTARSTAGLVGQIGVVKPMNMPDFIRIYNIWIHAGDSRTMSFAKFPEWLAFVDGSVVDGKQSYAIATSTEVVTQVIGVWDTVGSLGVPDLGHVYKVNNESFRKQYEFHDTGLTPQVKHAYQALALDERRAPFSPSVWTLTNANNGPDGRPRTNLCQCWFAGAHVNVGGGSSGNAVTRDPKNKITGDREQLASISYAWMLDRIRPHLALEPEALEKQMQEFEALAHQKIPASPQPEQGLLSWAKAKLFGPVKDVVETGTGYALSQIDDSHTMLYDVMGLPQARRPGQYHNVNSKGEHEDKGEYTVERIHPSVYFRQLAESERGVSKDKIYQPAAMKGWERISEENGIGRDGKPRKGWMWVKWKVGQDGKKTSEKDRFLWEFEIGHLPEKMSVEKRLIDGAWVEKVHELVQAKWRES